MPHPSIYVLSKHRTCLGFHCRRCGKCGLKTQKSSSWIFAILIIFSPISDGILREFVDNFEIFIYYQITLQSARINYHFRIEFLEIHMQIDTWPPERLIINTDSMSTCSIVWFDSIKYHKWNQSKLMRSECIFRLPTGLYGARVPWQALAEGETIVCGTCKTG